MYDCVIFLPNCGKPDFRAEPEQQNILFVNKTRVYLTPTLSGELPPPPRLTPLIRPMWLIAKPHPSEDGVLGS